MTQLEQLYQLYDAYEKKAKDVRSKASRFAGAFGLGDDPRNHGCHEAFFEDVAQWTQDFMKSSPSKEEMVQAVSWILKAADAHRDTDMYGYLYAAQGHTRAVIPHLPREESLELLQWYDRTYPVGDRMPAQQEVCRLLQCQAGVKPAPRIGLRNLFRRT